MTGWHRRTRLARIAATYDVFHFYYGESLLAARRDVPMLRRLGKRIIFHFLGCDIRLRGLSLAVAIRTAVVSGGELSYFAGGGLVSASDPDREIAETELKARVLFEACARLGSK